ncbi:MAG: hypothetical protein P9L92_15945 [Candidatus Electryonea clarkiae]|nr:hypothetical protein [Candidatus Electryonea clarkiae]MDP8285804.1 hypothetical protein [Candidatus Electryonea clarkiae]
MSFLRLFTDKFEINRLTIIIFLSLFFVVGILFGHAIGWFYSLKEFISVFALLVSIIGIIIVPLWIDKKHRTRQEEMRIEKLKIEKEESKYNDAVTNFLIARLAHSIVNVKFDRILGKMKGEKWQNIWSLHSIALNDQLNLKLGLISIIAPNESDLRPLENCLPAAPISNRIDEEYGPNKSDIFRSYAYMEVLFKEFHRGIEKQIDVRDNDFMLIYNGVLVFSKKLNLPFQINIDFEQSEPVIKREISKVFGKLNLFLAHPRGDIYPSVTQEFIDMWNVRL